jgi:hypothetical protein
VPGATLAHDSTVQDETVAIHLEISLAGDSMTGNARNELGVSREFDGRLGLLAAIDALIVGSTSSTPTSSDNG